MKRTVSYIYDGSLEAERQRLHLLERSTRARRARALEGALPANVHTILDVGCGAGALGFDLQKHFPGSALVAIDIDSSILREAQTRHQRSTIAAFVNADASRLPFAGEVFDLVACQYLLQHLSDPVGALREMRRVATARARLAVFDWDDGVNFSFPPMPARLQALFAAKTELVRLRGGDRLIGRKLHRIITSAGWKNVDVRIVPDIWQGPCDRSQQLAGTELGLRQIKPQLLSEALITEHDFEAAIRLLYDFFCGDVFSVVLYFAAFADKSGSPGAASE